MNNSQSITDKDLMQDVLMTAKTLTGLYHYATQESSSNQLHTQFKTNLNETLDMQNNIYTAMEQNGWYPQQKAEQKQINQVKTKYANSGS